MKVALLLILCWNIRDSLAIPSYTGEQLGTFTVEGQYVFSRLQHSGYHVTPVFLDISGFNFDYGREEDGLVYHGMYSADYVGCEYDEQFCKALAEDSVVKQMSLTPPACCKNGAAKCDIQKFSTDDSRCVPKVSELVGNTGFFSVVSGSLLILRRLKLTAAAGFLPVETGGCIEVKSGGKATIEKLVISGFVAGAGGAIFVHDDASPFTVLHATNTLIYSNRAIDYNNATSITKGLGGGVYVGEVRVEFAGVTITNNSAARNGAGLFACDGASIHFKHLVSDAYFETESTWSVGKFINFIGCNELQSQTDGSTLEDLLEAQKLPRRGKQLYFESAQAVANESTGFFAFIYPYKPSIADTFQSNVAVSLGGHNYKGPRFREGTLPNFTKGFPDDFQVGQFICEDSIRIHNRNNYLVLPKIWPRDWCLKPYVNCSKGISRTSLPNNSKAPSTCAVDVVGGGFIVKPSSCFLSVAASKRYEKRLVGIVKPEPLVIHVVRRSQSKCPQHSVLENICEKINVLGVDPDYYVMLECDSSPKENICLTIGVNLHGDPSREHSNESAIVSIPVFGLNATLLHLKLTRLIYPFASAYSSTVLGESVPLLSATSIGGHAATLSDPSGKLSGALFLRDLRMKAQQISDKLTTVVGVDETNRSMEFILPEYSSICNTEEECGFREFVITNPNSSFGRGGTFVFSVYYTHQCKGFTSLTNFSHLCSNPKLAWDANCAFGFEKTCTRCPMHAACPGGTRAWTEPGWWSVSTSSPDVRECLPPSEERCVGNSSCGTGYAGFRCNGCSRSPRRYYMSQSRKCIQCPQEGVANTARLLLSTAAYCVSVFVVIFLIVYFVKRKHGGTIRQGIYRARDFSIYFILVMQLLAQQVLNMAPELPDSFQYVLGWCALFRLDMSAFHHSACYSDSPFLGAIIMHTLVLFGCSCSALAYIYVHKQRRSAEKGILASITPYIGRWALTFLIISYAQSFNMVVWVISCDGDGNLLANGLISCSSLDRTPSLVLAACSLVFHCVSFPCVSFFLVRRKIKTHEGYEDKDPVEIFWRPFLHGTYRKEYFWFRHLQLALFGVLALTKNFVRLLGSDTSSIADSIISTILVAGFAIAILKFDPHSDRHKWKKYIVVGACFISVLIGCTDAVAQTEADDTVILTALSFISLGLLVMLLLTVFIYLIQQLKSGAVTEKNVLEKCARNAAASPGSRKDNWVMYHTNEGRCYYVNHTTGESAWTLPESETQGASESCSIELTSNPMPNDPVYSSNKSALGVHARKISEITGYSIDLNENSGENDGACLNYSTNNDSVASSSEGQKLADKSSANDSDIDLIRANILSEFERGATDFTEKYNCVGLWVEVHHDELNETVYFNTKSHEICRKRPKEWVRLMQERYETADGSKAVRFARNFSWRNSRF